MLNKRFVRISIGIILLILLIVSFVPNIYQSTASDGVISAHTTTLKSPIEGVLHYNTGIRHGQFFRKGEEIGKVVNSRVNHAFLNELETEHRSLTSRVKALSERISEFDKLMKRLSANLDNYQKFSIRQLEQMINQTQQKLIQEKAEYERAAKEYEANKGLLERLAVKQREFENSEANFRKAESRMREQDNRLVELKNSLDALKAGVFLGDGHNDVPYSSQRMDQLVIDASHAKTTMIEAADRIIGIEQQIATERERIKKAQSYVISAPFDSLVWRLPYTEGSSIAIGSELVTLLDCSSIFLDIVISESQFPDIKPGDSIQYRLMGESTYHNGKVFALRGSGSDIASLNLATTIGKDPKREFRIWAYPAPGSLDLKPENFFQVGRRIEVKLPRRWHPGREINRFFNVF